MTTSLTSLVDSAIVVDMVACNSPGAEMAPISNGVSFEPFIQHYIDAGVTWASLTVSADTLHSIEMHVKLIAASRNYILRRPEKFVLVNTVDDILKAKQEGKLGLNFNFQGTNALLGDLNMVETYRHLGVGHMLMVYNQKNLVGDGCHEKTDAGLSRYGEHLIQEMNQVGMIVDASHTGYRTTMDMFEVSTAPVIFSHSNPRALADHQRNIQDEQIKACAKTGGVVGINGVGIFLSEQKNDISADMIAQHIDYVAQLVGAKHVGLGLDFIGDLSPMQIQSCQAEIRDNPEMYPPTSGYSHKDPLLFSSPKVIPDVANNLFVRGYSESDVRGILGENFLRVCREVWL